MTAVPPPARNVPAGIVPPRALRQLAQALVVLAPSAERAVPEDMQAPRLPLLSALRHGSNTGSRREQFFGRSVTRTLAPSPLGCVGLSGLRAGWLVLREAEICTNEGSGPWLASAPARGGMRKNSCSRTCGTVRLPLIFQILGPHVTGPQLSKQRNQHKWEELMSLDLHKTKARPRLPMRGMVWRR